MMALWVTLPAVTASTPLYDLCICLQVLEGDTHREVFHLLVRSPYGCDNQSLARAKQALLPGLLLTQVAGSGHMDHLVLLFQAPSDK